jgi:lysophospholipase L1-like esterase
MCFAFVCRISWTLCALLTCAVLAATDARAADPAAGKIRIVLAGDSTTAVGSGWGPGFIPCLTDHVECINLARGGRSSSSFRAEGRWDEVQNLLRDQRYTTYVLIQFGHNDQPGKPGRSTDLLNEFPVNITRYVRDTQALGAHPVLVTPLTRRTFRGPVLKLDLAPWAATMRQVAAAERAPLLDLYALSADAVQAMGEDEADTLAMALRPAPGAPEPERSGASNPVFDRTHLGDKGARLFAGMVARELRSLRPELAAQLRP